MQLQRCFLCLLPIPIIPCLVYFLGSGHLFHAWTPRRLKPASDNADLIVQQWRPNRTVVFRLYSHLSLTRNQAFTQLPLTLRGPELISNNSLCRTEDGRPVDILFFVHTATSHGQRRVLLRRTFMAAQYFRPHNIKVRTVFLLGKVKTSEEQKQIQQEHVKFGDLVQGDFLDSYHNLSHKGVMGFRWITQHCATVRLVVKLDDDVFFDTFKLIHRYWAFVITKQRSIFCQPWRNAGIARQRKWMVDKKLFKRMNKYPYTYCNGMVVMMTGDLMPSLFAAAKISPVFWIDDVYLFGILPAIASNINYYNFGFGPGILNQNWKKALDCMKTKQLDCSMLASLAKGYELNALWNETLSQYGIGQRHEPVVHV